MPLPNASSKSSPSATAPAPLTGGGNSNSTNNGQSRIAYLQSYGNTVRTNKPPSLIVRWWRQFLWSFVRPSMHGGRNRVLCGGRVVTGRDTWAFLVAQVLLIAPCVLFAIFICPYLWYDVQPAAAIVFGYLFLVCLASMYYTSFTDPGIIPRNLDPYPNTSSTAPRDDAAIINANDDPYAPPATAPVPKETVVNGVTVPLKYCSTCKIYRPPRASHCRQCDNCVEDEDHHCVWLNNCVGRRNYRSFFTFIWSGSLLCIYVTVFSILHMLHEYSREDAGIRVNSEFIDVIRRYPVSLLLMIYCFIFLWSLGSLALYHAWLVSRNITTHEQIRRTTVERDERRPNPFDSGSIHKNCMTVLCRPRISPHINWRNQYMQQDQSQQAPPRVVATV